MGNVTLRTLNYGNYGVFYWYCRISIISRSTGGTALQTRAFCTRFKVYRDQGSKGLGFRDQGSGVEGCVCGLGFMT